MRPRSPRSAAIRPRAASRSFCADGRRTGPARAARAPALPARRPPRSPCAHAAISAASAASAYRDPMYVPRPNVIDDETEVRALVAAVAAAELITTGPDGYPLATLLPIIWREDIVIAHMARANRHWQHIAPDSPVLIVCDGPDAYISPSWYPAKAEHGRVVPTWNYSSVHLT